MKTANYFGYLEETFYRNSERNQMIEMAALGFLGFLIPFALGGPQIVVGAIVNALIIRSALSLPLKKALPALMAPSMGAVAQGMLFGPVNVFLVLMMPFIWAGNAALFAAFKLRIAKGYDYFATLLGGALAKAGLLFAAAYILYSASVLPAVFLTGMGMVQFATALLGGVLVCAMLRLEGRA